MEWLTGNWLLLLALFGPIGLLLYNRRDRQSSDLQGHGMLEHATGARDHTDDEVARSHR